MLAHISFYDNVTPWIVMAAGFIGVAWFNRKGRTGDALAYLEKANEILHKENLDLKKERQTLIAQTEALKAKTNIEVALRPLTNLMIKHDDEAERRFNRIVVILDLISSQLGKEVNGDDATG